jgi:hypothetical protein
MDESLRCFRIMIPIALKRFLSISFIQFSLSFCCRCDQFFFVKATPRFHLDEKELAADS